jgi:hypothetical protein
MIQGPQSPTGMVAFMHWKEQAGRLRPRYSFQSISATVLPAGMNGMTCSV